jgi:hypothetical protein
LTSKYDVLEILFGCFVCIASTENTPETNTEYNEIVEECEEEVLAGVFPKP